MTTEPETRNWLELPLDVTASILSRLGAIEILNSAQSVCSQWRKICKDPLMWSSIDMHNLGEVWDLDYDLVKMCVHAVDRSCGNLLDINVEYFGSDELLIYIAEKSGHLKRLRLISCLGILDEGLSEAASKLPLLEELEIYSCNTGKDAIEVVGRCCPLLKTFKYNGAGIRDPNFQDDEAALAIAQNMHGLRHLQLVGNNMTNHGLLAILDGCPYLESLDLRNCFHVNLEGDVERRCAEQIKNLRRPDDSIDDFKFSAEMNPSTEFTDDDYGLAYDDYDGYDGFDGYDSDFNLVLI